MEYFSEISWFLLEKCSSSLKKQFSFERSNSFNQVLLWVQELQSFWKEVLSNAKMAISFWDDALKKKKKQKLLQHEKLSSPFKQHNIPVKKLHLIGKGSHHILPAKMEATNFQPCHWCYDPCFFGRSCGASCLLQNLIEFGQILESFFSHAMFQGNQQKKKRWVS